MLRNKNNKEPKNKKSSKRFNVSNIEEPLELISRNS